MWFVRSRKYFDYASYTPIAKEVVVAMRAVQKKEMCGQFANANAEHKAGKRTRDFITEQVKSIAAFFEVPMHGVVMTSGASESNAVVFRSVVTEARHNGVDFADMHLVVGKEEHDSVLRIAKMYESYGVQGQLHHPKRKRHLRPCCHCGMRASTHAPREHSICAQRYRGNSTIAKNS